MGLLKWFNKSKYSGISEALGDIRKELEALQPADSSDIVWSKSANGISASLRASDVPQQNQEDVDDTSNGGGGGGYNGYFKILVIPYLDANGQPEVDEDGNPTNRKCIAVVNGSNYKAGDPLTYAFNSCKVQGSRHKVPAFVSDPCPESYSVYIDLAVERNVHGYFEPRIVLTESSKGDRPKPEVSESIGYVRIWEGNVEEVRQDMYGEPHLLVFADCDALV